MGTRRKTAAPTSEPESKAAFFEEEESAFRTKIPFSGQKSLAKMQLGSAKDPFAARFEQLQEVLEDRKNDEKEQELKETVLKYMRNDGYQPKEHPYSQILDKYRSLDEDRGSRYDDVKSQLESRYDSDRFDNYRSTDRDDEPEFKAVGDMLPKKPISYMGARTTDLCGTDAQCLSNQLFLAADQLDPDSRNYVSIRP